MMDDRLNEDFPIDWEEDAFVSRREFFKFMTLASGGLALGSAGMAAFASLDRESRVFDAVRIARTSEVPPGTAVSFGYPTPKDMCILIRQPDGTFAAFSRRCTHLSCPVDYQAGADRLYCPCHNGAFSARDGSVLQGPPPHALHRIEIEEREGELWAVGVRPRSRT